MSCSISSNSIIFCGASFAAVFLLVVVKIIAPCLELSRNSIRLTTLDNLADSIIASSALLKIRSYCPALSLLK
jgi:hypothetical protein